MNKEKILEAGKITSEVKAWIRPQIKKDMGLLDLAEKIEFKIIELGGKPAFPVSLSIDEIAAHSTPGHDDSSKAKGLLKVDFGTHIDGWIADNAFSVDLEDDGENKKIISASEKALENALKIVKKGISTNEIGQTVQETISSLGFSPIVNLSGHSMEKYSLHAGISIPNVEGSENKKLVPGLYAIEPFATNGNGKIHNGNPSGIYLLLEGKKPRTPLAREILEFVKTEYSGLPFCSRWIVKKFGTKSLLALKELEKNGNIHNYAQLIETSKGKVSQSEESILIDENGEVIVTTS